MGEVISFPKPNPDRDTARLIQNRPVHYMRACFRLKMAPPACSRTRPHRPSTRAAYALQLIRPFSSLDLQRNSASRSGARLSSLPAAIALRISRINSAPSSR